MMEWTGGVWDPTLQRWMPYPSQRQRGATDR